MAEPYALVVADEAILREVRVRCLETPGYRSAALIATPSGRETPYGALFRAAKAAEL
jgi:hypothetical protein